MDFDALNDFRLVVHHGGFGKASRATGRPKASLSKRVIELEDRLGVRLLDREGGKIRLTEEGEQLLSRAEHLLDEVDQIREEISAGIARPRGKLRIAAPNLFSHIWMGKLTARFLIQYPEVVIETIVVDRPIDAPDEWFDVLIQVNPGPLVDLVGKIFARDDVRIVAPANFLDAIKLQDGIEIPAITPSGAVAPTLWKLLWQKEIIAVKPRSALQLPSRLMIRDALCEGIGMAELPRSIIASDVEAGRLVDLGPAPRREVEIWALHSSRRLTTRKVTAFIELLVKTFRGSMVEL
jgi:DNA-binding transcriptional LysR family regulator